ncbi:MAG: biotin transporter BioY [Candidatus Omnitrophica bacterium]|nr:biotin transporter BioY [Candidatus Omnitrophota bacterium]
MQVKALERCIRVRFLFFQWRCSASLVKRIALAFAMAGLTGLLAQIRIYLPFTPVPITGQVLGVLLSGIICGGVFGCLSQIIYVGLGIMGIPWLAGGGGYHYILLHPTLGYFIGFIIAPLLIGGYTDRHIEERRLFSQLKFMLLGVGIIYLFGAIGLAVTLRINMLKAIAYGVFPFILIDGFKAFIAAGISSSILPKTRKGE